MIVRTYGRRSRCADRSLAGAGGHEFDPPLSHGPDPFALAFSSQDSSPWSLVPDLPTPVEIDPRAAKSSKAGRNSKRGEIKIKGLNSTATLMEAQEYGEMMEHVDEVNFSLDGLRLGQPVRIRRASLLSLLSICGTAQQRRILRAQGMANRIIDAILGLKFDDSPSTVAAAALFYVLASDVPDDHLLDSPSCIHFLLTLLNPPLDTLEDKGLNIGCKLLGIRKPHILGGSNNGIDSSSRAIMSKVQEILLSCKEIKSSIGDDGERGRPELSSKWIALLTMEKACISTVSFEDTSDIARRVRGNFKERLRELGGLDAVFDVVSTCQSTMVGWFKHNSPSVSDLKDGVPMQSLVLILKCLKIMENATFLSKANQDHLLKIKGKVNHEEFSLSFVGVVINAIKDFSALSLLQSSSISINGKPDSVSKSFDADFCTSPKIPIKGNQTGTQNGTATSSSQNGCYCIEPDSHMKSTKVCHKRQKLSASQSEVSVSVPGSEMAVASGTDGYHMKTRSYRRSSISCNGALSVSNGERHIPANRLKRNIKANGLKAKSVGGSNGCISIKANTSKMNSGSLSKRPCVSEHFKSECTQDSSDPFAFDEGGLEPSKWELLATRKETSQSCQSTVLNTELVLFDQPIVTNDQDQLTNEESNQSCENSCSSMVEEESDLLEDCLLTAIKVLMNLTNDNPVGCQQIAACGGLDTMASLIISHFPSFDICFPLHNQSEVIISTSNQRDDGHRNSRHLSDHELDFLVAILGLLVNLVEKDSRNRSRLAYARISVDQPGRSESKENDKDVITLLCSIFLANQGAAEVAEEGRLLLCDDEASLLQGEREAEMMIIEAYSALLLAFLSTESNKVREAIASCLPNHSLNVLVPVLERFVEFHMTLKMISPETHSAVVKVIESCKGSS